MGEEGNTPTLPPLDPEVEVDPYTLFRQLSQGEAPRLLLLPRNRWSLVGAEPWDPQEDPPEGEALVLVDDDGRAARRVAQRLHRAGHRHVRALYGGVRFYDYCLDPQVVGEERYVISPVSE